MLNKADDSVKLTESIKHAVKIGYRHFDLGICLS